MGWGTRCLHFVSSGLPSPLLRNTVGKKYHTLTTHSQGSAKQPAKNIVLTNNPTETPPGDQEVRESCNSVPLTHLAS